MLRLLQDSGAVLALLNIASGVSRVHASRRFFERLQSHGIDIPVIHQRTFPAGAALTPTHGCTCCHMTSCMTPSVSCHLDVKLICHQCSRRLCSCPEELHIQKTLAAVDVL